MAAASLFVAALAGAQGTNPQGQAVLTVLPKGGDGTPLAPGNLHIKVNGKPAEITALTAFHGSADPIELVILIDGSARSSLGGQLSELVHFIRETPSGTRIAVAYMQNGQALLATPLTDDPAQAERGVHLPAGSAGSSASPYFCLSDLAKHWPSNNPQARREVLMITDGVDPYNQRLDPQDPYVQTAIDDAVRARLIVDSIYWTSRGSADSTASASYTGQSLLNIVSEETGGKSFWQGSGNPVDFDSYFVDLRHRLHNQYLLTFTAPLHGNDKTAIASLDLKAIGATARIEAPKRVMLRPARVAEK
jgi:hypothetical protein